MRPTTALAPSEEPGEKEKVPSRWRKLAVEASKFGIVGVVNTVVDFIVFNLFLPIGPLKANALSTVVATTSSYVLNRHWTWRDQAAAATKATIRREYLLFFLFNLIGFAIQIAILGAAKYGLDFTEHKDRAALNIAKGVGIAIGTVFRFWAYRTWVFRAPTPTADEATPVDEPAATADEPEAATPTATATVPTRPLPSASRDKAPAEVPAAD